MGFQRTVRDLNCFNLSSFFTYHTLAVLIHDVRYIDLIALDIPGHFYAKRSPVRMLEKATAGSPPFYVRACSA